MRRSLAPSFLDKRTPFVPKRDVGHVAENKFCQREKISKLTGEDDGPDNSVLRTPTVGAPNARSSAVPRLEPVTPSSACTRTGGSVTPISAVSNCNNPCSSSAGSQRFANWSVSTANTLPLACGTPTAAREQVRQTDIASNDYVSKHASRAVIAEMATTVVEDQTRATSHNEVEVVTTSVIKKTCEDSARTVEAEVVKDIEQVPSSASSSLVAAADTKQQFISFIVICRPTPEQETECAAILRSGKKDGSILPRVRKLLNHPWMLDASKPFEPEESGKLRVLTRLILSMASGTSVTVVVSVAETEEMLGNWLIKVQPIPSTLTVVSLEDWRKQGDKACQCVVYFDFIPRSDLSFQWSTHGNSVIIYRLVTGGSMEEREMLDDLQGLPFEASKRDDARLEILKQSTSSGSCELVAAMKEKESRFRMFPEEEFAELWPSLLALGWNAEPGGGLVDYYYCKPNITSKGSGKSGKTKGQKNEDFFASKAKVVKAIKEMSSVRERAELIHGLHDLAYWTRHPNLSSVINQALKCVGDECVSFVFSLQGEFQIASDVK